MSKLLTEQELSDKVVEILGIRNDLQRHHVLSGAMPTLVKLIQSQKQAHANMVIGEDFDTSGKKINPYPTAWVDVNKKLAEQRERNKS